MQLRVILPVVFACLVQPDVISACGRVEGGINVPPLTTRKPVLSDNAVFVSSFGIRLHPLLNERRFHAGIDWAASIGTPVIAAGGGRIVTAAGEKVYGNLIAIDHGGGWQTRYAHLASINVSEGECVAPGTIIGTVGTTGLTVAPLLHFEVQRFDRHVDPMALAIP